MQYGRCPDGCLWLRPEEPGLEPQAAEPEAAEGRQQGRQHRWWAQAGEAAEMTELERIQQMGREWMRASLAAQPASPAQQRRIRVLLAPRLKKAAA